MFLILQQNSYQEHLINILFFGGAKLRTLGKYLLDQEVIFLSLG